MKSFYFCDTVTEMLYQNQYNKIIMYFKSVIAKFNDYF